MTFSVCICSATGAWWANQWGQLLSHWLPEFVYFQGEVDNRVGISFDSPVVYIDTAEEIPEEPTLVALSPASGRFVAGTESLEPFVHPESCVYMFGPDHLHLSEVQLGERVPDHVVYIPSETHHEMYSWMALHRVAGVKNASTRLYVACFFLI